MTHNFRHLIVLATLMVCTNLIASIEVFEFSSNANREQYYSLTKELRCPKCQNQDIADSNAPIAQDMRREVYRLVEEGESTDAVVQYMVDRFGEFVSYDPKIIPATYLLWFGPLTLVGIGLLVVLLLSRRTAQRASSQSVTIDASARKRLDDMLKEPDKNQSKESGKGSK